LKARSASAARLRATAVHLVASAAVVTLAGLLVFLVWYPGPYRELAGGTRLFGLIAAVDLALGPLLTLAVFDIRKSRRQLAADIGVIALLQLIGLAYGVWTMAAARPAYLVFEVDLFRVVTAYEIPAEFLAQAPTGLQALPWGGPKVIGVTQPQNPDQSFEATARAMQGQPLAALANFWVPYDNVRKQAMAKSRPISDLRTADIAVRAALNNALDTVGITAQQARWLPVVSRRATWTVLLNPAGDPVAYLPVDPY